jgi:hypothetical protein
MKHATWKMFVRVQKKEIKEKGEKEANIYKDIRS